MRDGNPTASLTRLFQYRGIHAPCPLRSRLRVRLTDVRSAALVSGVLYALSSRGWLTQTLCSLLIRRIIDGALHRKAARRYDQSPPP